MVSGSAALGDLRLGDIKSATYDYYADYEFNAIRVTIESGISEGDADKHVKYAADSYGKLGKVSYDKEQKAVQLVAELQPGKEPPHLKTVSRIMKGPE